MYLTAIFFLTLIIPFLAMPRHIKLGILSPYRIVLLSTIGVSAAAAVVFMAAALSGTGLYSQLHEMMKVASEEVAVNPMILQSFDASGMSEADIAEFVMQVYDAGLMRLPITIMTMGAVVSYIAYIIISRLMSRKNDVKLMPKFREFTFPHGAAMAVMLMYLIGWMMMEAEVEVGAMLFLNFSALFDLVFVIQAIAVVLMFFHFKKVPQIVAVLICIVMCVTSFGKAVMVLLGMTDLFFGLRMRMGGRAGR